MIAEQNVNCASVISRPIFARTRLPISSSRSWRRTIASRWRFFSHLDVARGDEVTLRFQKLATQFRNIHGQSDARVAAKIVEDQIDILVDLAGHTANSRLPLFASKPAPILVTYLGYPNTTGLSTMDYRLTDAGPILPVARSASTPKSWSDFRMDFSAINRRRTVPRFQSRRQANRTSRGRSRSAPSTGHQKSLYRRWICGRRSCARFRTPD